MFSLIQLPTPTHQYRSCQISCVTQSFPYYTAKYRMLYENKKDMVFATFMQQPLSQVPRKWGLGRSLQSIQRLRGQNNALLNVLWTQPHHSQLQKWGRTGTCRRPARSLQGLPLILPCLQMWLAPTGTQSLRTPVLSPEFALQGWKAGSDPTDLPNFCCSAAQVEAHQKLSLPALQSQGHQLEIQHAFYVFYCLRSV